MFSGTADIKIQRVPFFPTVGDAIIRKNFSPRRAIHADISAFDATGRLFDIEYDPRMIARDLHLTH